MYIIKMPKFLSIPLQDTADGLLKTYRWLQFIYALIIKDFGSCLRHVWYRCRYLFNPDAHNMNPMSIEKPCVESQTARVILLLHGVGGHASCFIPLAHTLKDASIYDVYTIKLVQTAEDPVPIDSLSEKIDHLHKKYTDIGYADVQFALIGHSLGALASAKYIWREWNMENSPAISLFISLGGRLKNHENAFAWFCEDVKPEVEQTYRAILSSPDKADLYSIHGDRDVLVSEESAHVFGNPKQERTINGWSHGGIVFAPEAHRLILSWIQKWKRRALRNSNSIDS